MIEESGGQSGGHFSLFRTLSLDINKRSLMLTKKQMSSLPIGRHSIESNVLLCVRSNTNKYFSFRYQINGKRKELKIGHFETTNISQLRERVAHFRLLLSRGIDPQYAKIKRKQEIRETLKRNITLKEFYNKILPDILNAKQLHGDNSKRKYTHMPYTYIMPVLGSMPISEITTEDIVRCLKPLWKRVPPSALKMRLVLESIFGYAKKLGYYEGDNPAAFKFNLDMYLPAYGKIHETVHRRSANNDDFLHMLKLLAVWHWWFPKALQPLYIMLTALLACRANESCDLVWAEIDLQNKTITLPRERKKFKTGDPFVIPLSEQAIWILTEIRKVNTATEDFIFKRNNGTRLHNENARKFMTSMPTCLHGMRTNFRNWCLRAGISDAVAEISLMHAYGKDATVRSYLRDDLIDLRFEAMQQWADYILPMHILKAEFLTEEQKAKMKAVPYHEKGKGWVGLYKDQWDLGL